jgi:hypothetical protein
MTIADKVIQAVRQHWGIQSGLEEHISLHELEDDWIVWRRQDAEKAGGVRLVVPKHGMQAFEIPSSAFADDQHGVSCEYEMRLQHPVRAGREAATIIEKHTGMSRVESYRFLKSGLSAPGRYFIASPIELIRESRDHNVYLNLLRPGDRGGYSSSSPGTE